MELKKIEEQVQTIRKKYHLTDFEFYTIVFAIVEELKLPATRNRDGVFRYLAGVLKGPRDGTRVGWSQDSQDELATAVQNIFNEIVSAPVPSRTGEL